MESDKLKSKIRNHYIGVERNKLYSDPMYQYFNKMLSKIMIYSASPKVTIKNNQLEYLPNADIHAIEMHKNAYIMTHYPILYFNGKEATVRQSYDNYFIETPERLSLTEIDKRLTLFKHYLRYKMDNIHLTPLLHMLEFKSTGYMFYSHDGILTFDEWLYANDYDRLVTVHFH